MSMFRFLQKSRPDEESSAAAAVKDAVLLGHVEEIDAALDLIGGKAIYSDELRHGLEALRYFRAYYGAGGELEPRDLLQKQKAVLLEQAYGAEVLQMVEEAKRATAQSA